MNLYLDIETIPDQREGAFESILENIKPPGQYKKEESIQKWKDTQGKEVAEEEYHKTGLKGISGEICSIAWAVDNGEIIASCRNQHTSEAWLIRDFFACIAQENKNGEGLWPMITWIGHNVIDFDLRFIKQRAIINKVRPNFVIPADAKHGGQFVFDTMKEWAGWKGFVSQDALAKALGLEGKGDIDGSMVWDLYQAGEYEKIQEYNKNDVETVRKIYKRLIWNS